MNQITPNHLNRILTRMSIESSSFFKGMLYLVLLVQGFVWIFVLLQILGISQAAIQMVGLFLTILSFILYEIYQARRKMLKQIPKNGIDAPEMQRKHFRHHKIR